MNLKSVAYLISILFILNNCSSTSLVQEGTIYDGRFMAPEINNIEIVYYDLDYTNQIFWDLEQAEDLDPDEFGNDIIEGFTRLLDLQEIGFSDNHVEIEPEYGSLLIEDASYLQVYMDDLLESKGAFFGFSSNIDYSDVVRNPDSEFALYIQIEPVVYLEEWSVANPVANNTRMEWSNELSMFEIFSYLVEVETNQVVWVYKNNEFINLDTFQPSYVGHSIVSALIKGQDLTIKSFDLTRHDELFFTEKNGRQYAGKVVKVEDYKITIEANGLTEVKELSEFSEIFRNAFVASNGKMKGNNVYPVYLGQ